MADVLGLGITHSPLLCRVDEDLTSSLRRTLAGKRVPERARDPRNWPAAMRAEWSDDEGVAAARAHRERCFAAMRVLRARLDRFQPDAVVILGDDQYENFTEDLVPPFCIYITASMESRPFAVEADSTVPMRNIWNEGFDTLFSHRGHPDVGRWMATRLSEEGLPLPYAYRLRYWRGLAHAFINTLLFLDVDRKGFPYPVVPFHVNCYGVELIRSRGGMVGPNDPTIERDPPSPAPSTCFDVGRAVARALVRSPWRIALIASSSWSHATLTEKNDWIFPDHASDRDRLAELRAGKFARWRELSSQALEDAGQHEFLNWVTLAGAMSELGKRAEVIDWIETYVVNSNKCLAVFDCP